MNDTSDPIWNDDRGAPLTPAAVLQVARLPVFPDMLLCPLA
ncbi:MAG: hypothetical protein RMJ60_01605 [Anaerolineales bacterium]|nr:hypothetical protein [Anaerolineales bacterium]